MPMNCLRLAGVLAAALLAIAAGVAGAQSFPDRPILIVVPYAPGATDREARALAPVMERELGQPVQVDNREGGGATIGTNFVLKGSHADGYTLLYVASAPLTIAPYIRKLPYTFDDAMPLAQATVGTHLMVARTDAPFKTVREMVAYAKANPGKVSLGNSGGVGGATHMANEAFAAAAGIQVNQIPFQGLAQSLAAILSGTLDSATGLPIALAPQIEAGKIRPLAQMGATRSPWLPDVPTLKESGVDLALQVSIGFYLPKGVPQPVADKLQRAIEVAVKSPEFAAFAQKARTVPTYLNAQQFAAALEPERRLIGELVPRLNIRQ